MGNCNFLTLSLKTINNLIVFWYLQVITDKEAERRGKQYDAVGRTYLFDLDYNPGDCPFTVDAGYYGNVSHFINHSVRILCLLEWHLLLIHLEIDIMQYFTGKLICFKWKIYVNIKLLNSRIRDGVISFLYFLSQCDPNLEVFAVWINTLDPRLPRIALFSKRDIEKGEELTFDYMMTGECSHVLFIEENKFLLQNFLLQNCGVYIHIGTTYSFNLGNECMCSLSWDENNMIKWLCCMILL